MPVQAPLLQVQPRGARVGGEPEPQHGRPVLVFAIVGGLQNEEDVPGGEPLDVLDPPALEERLELVAQLGDVVGRQAHRSGPRLAQASSSFTE